MRILDEYEMHAARGARVMPGAEELLRSLHQRGLKLAVFTRNSRGAARAAITALNLDGYLPLIVSRDDAPPKPDPRGLLLIARQWQLPVSDLLYVGDYIYDLEAGERAGIETWLYAPSTPDFEHRAKTIIQSFDELAKTLMRQAD